MESIPVRFALVGAGAIAQTYAIAFRSTPLAKLVAVVDPQVDAASAMAEAERCEAFESLESCLGDMMPDAAIVCAPPSFHASLAMHLLRAGIHVLCEKPLALGRNEAVAMLECAHRSDRVLAMASKFRYVADVVRAKSILESGLLGDTIQYENIFTARVDMSRRWNADPRVSGGGVTIDNGCHAADLMRYLIGPIREVSAVEAMRIAGLSVDETVQLTCRTAGGAVGRVDLSWSMHRDVDYYVRIYGTQGVMSIGWKESRYRLNGASDWVVFGNGYDRGQAFFAQLRNFAGSLLGAESVLVSPADAFASVAVVEAAYASMRSGLWTSVDELCVPVVARAS